VGPPGKQRWPATARCSSATTEPHLPHLTRAERIPIFGLMRTKNKVGAGRPAVARNSVARARSCAR
jgi:hypothetical protein